MRNQYLHERPDFIDLLRIIEREAGFDTVTHTIKGQPKFEDLINKIKTHISDL